MNAYPHMCRDGHTEIGHSDSEHERCPLCRAQDLLLHYGGHKSNCRLMTALRNLPNLNRCTCGWDEVLRATVEANAVQQK